eukprot:14646644-Heterocapsa_arctica.AAC.1
MSYKVLEMLEAAGVLKIIATEFGEAEVKINHEQLTWPLEATVHSPLQMLDYKPQGDQAHIAV